MKPEEFNQMSEQIGLLEHELIQYGETKDYLMQLKISYVEMLDVTSDMIEMDDILGSYYDHLKSIAKVKYYGLMDDYWRGIIDELRK